MNQIRTILTPTLFFTLLIFGGCNAVNDPPPKSDVMESRNLASLCEIDPNAFKNILTKDVSTDLVCLRSNFLQFMSSVETDRHGYLSKNDLISFINHYFESNAQDIIKGLHSLFNINYLLTGSEVDYMSKAELNNLLNFLIYLNQEIVKIYPYFKDTSEHSDIVHYSQRMQILQTATNLSNQLIKLMEGRDSATANLDIIDVVKNFLKENDEDNLLGKIKGLLFVKRILLGGDKNLLSHREMRRLVTNIPELTAIIFDLIKLKKINFTDQESQYELIQEDVKRLDALIVLPASSTENLFHLDEVIEASKPFAESFIDLSKYPNTVFELKKVLVDSRNNPSPSKSVTRKDFSMILTHIYKILDEGLFFGELCRKYQDLIESPLRISHPMDDFPTNTPAEAAHLKHFREILYGYRFFKGDFDAPFYSNTFHRNPKALNEVALLEYALNLMMNFYGTETEVPGKYAFFINVDKDPTKYKNDLLQIMLKYRDLLLDKKLIILGREIASSENTFMLANLFQYQSNGSKFIDLVEATEFGYTILSGISIGDYITAELRIACKTDGTNRELPLECFQQHFFSVLRNKYEAYFPKMFKFVDDNINNGNAVQNLIEMTAKFSRPCPDKSTLNDNDMVSILGGLLNVESTLIRYDTNQDNILDYPELSDAYKVYKDNIEALVKKSASYMVPLSKEIFLFLVKYQIMPDIKKTDTVIKFAKFLLLEKKDQVTGDRTAVAGILQNLGLLAKKDREDRGVHDPEGMCKPTN